MRSVIIFLLIILGFLVNTVRADYLYFNHPEVRSFDDNNVIKEGAIYRVELSSGKKTVVLSGLSNPGGLALDSEGNLYFGDETDPHDARIVIFRMSPDGNVTRVTDGVDAGEGHWSSGYMGFNLLIDKKANVLYFNHPEVRSFDDNSVIKEGAIYRVELSSGKKTVVLSGLSNPGGLALDSEGNLYFGDETDPHDARIVIFRMSPDGNVTRVTDGVDAGEGFYDPGYLKFCMVSSKVATGPENYIGDVNGDASVDIVDALLVARYAVQLPVLSFDENDADVNCDGQINIVDALFIARKAVELPVNGWCGGG